MLPDMKVFNVTEDCIVVAENEEYRAYWVTTSHCLFFVDKEFGRNLFDGFAPILDTQSEAEAYAKEMLPTP